MFEQVVGVVGGLVVIAGVFFAIVALAVWLLDAPGRKEDRARRKRYEQFK